MGQSPSSCAWLKEVGFDKATDPVMCAKIWALYDFNHDGVLDRREAEHFVYDWYKAHNIRPTRAQVNHFFRCFDKNGDGKISRDELLGTEYKLDRSDLNDALLSAMTRSLSRGVPGLFFGEEAVVGVDYNTHDRQTALERQLPDHLAFEKQNFPRVDFDELEPSMNTGDLLLLSGQYGVSHYTKLVQGSQHSHCGVVIRHNGELHIWESTQCTTADAFTGIIRGGPGLHNLRDRLRKYFGYMVYRKLNWRPPADLEQRIRRIHENTQDSYYDTDVWEGTKAFLNINGHPDNTAFFCSEFVAYVYQELGVIGRARAANTYFPSDFSSQGGGLAVRRGTPESNKAKLLHGATFGPEQTLTPKWPHDLKTMLLEEYLISTGVSISRSALQEQADCNVVVEIESTEGFILNRYGKKIHRGKVNVFVAVGIVPEEQRICTEYAYEQVKVGQVLSLPCIANHPYLSFWFIIREGEDFGAVVGAAYTPLTSLTTLRPLVPNVYKARTGNIRARLYLSRNAQPQSPLSPRMKALRLNDVGLEASQASRVIREGLPVTDGEAPPSSPKVGAFVD